MAAAQGTMNNFTFGDATYQYYETICGGSGAGPDFDGTSAVHTHMTNSRLTDPEVLEWRYPVVLESHRINKGSGGAGRHKGGDGTIRRIRFLEPMSAALLSNHRKVAPFGLEGGSPGAVGRQWVERADGRIEDLPGCAKTEMAPRRRLRDPDPRRRRVRNAGAGVRVVLDTDVVVAGARSDRGASFQWLLAALERRVTSAPVCSTLP